MAAAPCHRRRGPAVSGPVSRGRGAEVISATQCWVATGAARGGGGKNGGGDSFSTAWRLLELVLVNLDSPLDSAES